MASIIRPSAAPASPIHSSSALRRPYRPAMLKQHSSEPSSKLTRFLYSPTSDTDRYMSSEEELSPAELEKDKFLSSSDDDGDDGEEGDGHFSGDESSSVGSGPAELDEHDGMKKPNPVLEFAKACRIAIMVSFVHAGRPKLIDICRRASPALPPRSQRRLSPIMPATLKKKADGKATQEPLSSWLSAPSPVDYSAPSSASATSSEYADSRSSLSRSSSTAPSEATTHGSVARPCEKGRSSDELLDGPDVALARDTSAEHKSHPEAWTSTTSLLPRERQSGDRRPSHSRHRPLMSSAISSIRSTGTQVMRKPIPSGPASDLARPKTSAGDRPDGAAPVAADFPSPPQSPHRLRKNLLARIATTPDEGSNANNSAYARKQSFPRSLPSGHSRRNSLSEPIAAQKLAKLSPQHQQHLLWQQQQQRKHAHSGIKVSSSVVDLSHTIRPERYRSRNASHCQVDSDGRSAGRSWNSLLTKTKDGLIGLGGRPPSSLR